MLLLCKPHHTQKEVNQICKPTIHSNHLPLFTVQYKNVTHNSLKKKTLSVNIIQAVTTFPNAMKLGKNSTTKQRFLGDRLLSSYSSSCHYTSFQYELHLAVFLSDGVTFTKVGRK